MGIMDAERRLESRRTNASRGVEADEPLIQLLREVSSSLTTREVREVTQK